ncbi:MAG TPA: BTAD domain-containing putative transcriptional regulator [Acidimicrobiales bacterium]|nr:BTAD domain-containing putative transcriptional regulator [Acidimicrobiales bacterium]
MALAECRGRFEPLTAGRSSLVRPRLLDRLRERFGIPVVVVAAPAGFGKTTLLAQAFEENRLVPDHVDIWLACRPDDAAASVLSAGLCEAVGVVPPPGGAGAVDAVAEAIWHHSPRPVALLVDDVHEIPDGSPGAEMLAMLVAKLPRNGHLVLSGRVPPPLPLARAEVLGQVLRLGEAELMFTTDELVEFAARRGVPDERLSDCGGWPALAELAASAAPDVEAAYMWEEVLAAVPPTQRRDLALLAHIGAFDDNLATAVLGHEVDLESLTADLPLVARTPEGGRLIHSLWQPFLAQVVTKDEIAEARRRAGVALARTGDVAPAVTLIADAEAWNDMTRVVVDALGAAHAPVPGDVVAAWRRRLPNDTRCGALARLLDAIITGQTDPEVAASGLSGAMDAFRQSGDVDGELACLAQLAQLAWWWERPEQMVGAAARVLELENAGHDRAASLACLARALVHDVANDCAAAIAELDRISPGSLNQTWQSLVDWLRSTSLSHLGRPEEALDAAERACAHPSPLHEPLIESARLTALWFHGRVGEVLRQLPPLVDHTAAVGLPNYTVVMAAACCTALALAGRPKDASPYLERARQSAASRDVPLIDVNLTIAEAALSVARGDDSGAAVVLEDYLARSPLLGPGHAAAPQQRVLALWYVLVPASREVWDAATLGPCFAVARDLARAVVTVRAGSPAPASPVPHSPDLVRAHLPLRWATELALAEIATGRQTGWALLEALWPAAQPEVRRHAVHPGTGLARPARSALSRLPVPPRGLLELRLLGPTELRRDGAPVDAPDWRRERVRSLLAYLVLHGQASRERLGDRLWPELDADAQSRNLRVTLTYLLRVLEPERSERDASFLIRQHGGGLILEPGDWFVADIWAFDDLWQRAIDADRRGAPSDALGHMRRAVALWRGDPSELANEPWALAEAEEQRLRLVKLAVRAGELLLAKGEADDARAMGDAALRVDPWSEPAHSVVVRSHAAIGDHLGARRALARYRDALIELGTSAADSASQAEQLARAASGGGRPVS